MSRPRGAGNTQRYRELADAGMTGMQIAQATGVNPTSVYTWAKRHKVVLARAPRGLSVPGGANARFTKMAEMHRQGCTLQTIGNQYGISRERVRQILAKQGVKSSDGGAHAIAEIKAERRQARREAAALRDYGLPLDVVCELRSNGLMAAYSSQRNAARIRGIDWRLDFSKWHAVWHTSGKLHLRGRGKGKYVMSRIKDDGPYALGNIHIQLATENSREAVAKWKGKEKANRGVYCLYPGRKLAWLAKAANISLGYFETESEAVAARKAYFVKNPDTRRTGKGYAITGTKEKPRYQVMVGKKYIGSFKTPSDALAARERFIESQFNNSPKLKEASHA